MPVGANVKSPMSVWVVIAVASGLTCTVTPDAAAQDPSALWRIVHEQCVPRAREFGVPLPCADVQREYAILKDLRGKSQFLLIATARISGVDDPAILLPAVPNYWQSAWEATRFVEALLDRHLPRDALSLAINSARSRSQDQLHIHIDCVSEDVRKLLRDRGRDVGRTWAPFPAPLSGHAYRAMRIDTLIQPGATPFEVLARLPDARADMAAESLVVVGATFEDGSSGFYLLETRVAGGEELQDHDCAVASGS
jgi:CDP-diacylglycerol pyrophosphatase